MSRKGRLLAELAGEIRDHIDRETADNVALGMSPVAARRAATLRFGSPATIREETRAVWTWRWLEELKRDGLHALRTLRRSPGFTLVAVLSLALGIGANTAAFGLVKNLLLRPLPYPDADRLVMIWTRPADEPNQTTFATIPDYMRWKAQARSLDVVGAMGPSGNPAYLDGNGDDTPEEVVVQRFTASLFRVLGTAPIVGRTFTEDEERLDNPSDVIVISHRLWQRRFGGNRAVVQQTLRVSGAIKRIVGVMPAGFSYAFEDADIWTPVNWSRTQLQGSARGFMVAARLKPDVTIEQAQADLAAISLPAGDVTSAVQSWKARLEPLHAALFGPFVGPLLILEGIVALVLLIACANLAGLLLARAATRRSEIAVRAAVGAGRARLIRQLLTESLLLAALGGVAALAVAWVGMQLILASPVIVPGMRSLAVDWPLLAFTAAVALSSGVAFGVVPAIQMSGANMVDGLQVSGRNAMDRPSMRRLRRSLVIVQIAMAVVLLVGSALLVNSFMRVRYNPLGADTHGLLTFEVRFPGPKYQRRVGSYDGFPLLEISPEPSLAFTQLWRDLKDLPGVEAAAGINHLPFQAAEPEKLFTIDGRADAATDTERAGFSARHAMVTPEFFHTMKVPLLRGRDFSESDTTSSPWVVIINEAMARRFWPHDDPIGKHLQLRLVSDEQPREVIAIAKDMRASPFEAAFTPAMYTLQTQQPMHNRAPYGGERLGMSFVIRTAGDPMAMVPAARHLTSRLGLDRPVTDFRLVDEHIAYVTSGPRYLMTIVTTFAGIATLLASIGLYGVISSGVAQRTKELGVRVALGADRMHVAVMIVREVLWLLAAGLSLGVVGALALTSLIAGVLWGVTATDVPTYLGVVLLVVVVGLVSAVFPTWRATRVAPTVALRCD